jgi:hypothetical protein
MLVLTLLLILPLFEANFYTEAYSSWQFAVDALDTLQNSSGYGQAVEAFINYQEDRRRPLIKLERDLDSDATWSWEDGDTDSEDLRQVEKSVGISGDFLSIVDLREDTRLEAGLNI